MIQWFCGIIKISSLTSYCCYHIFNRASSFYSGVSNHPALPGTVGFLGWGIFCAKMEAVLDKSEWGSPYTWIFFFDSSLFSHSCNHFFPSENISYRFLKGLFSWFLTTVLGIASTSFELFWFIYFSLSLVLEIFHKYLATGWSHLYWLDALAELWGLPGGLGKDLAYHCKIARCQHGALISQVSQFSQMEILHVLLGGHHSRGAGLEQRMW